MSNKPGFFRQLKDTQNYSTKFLIVLFSPNSGVTPNNSKQAQTKNRNNVYFLNKFKAMTNNDKQFKTMYQ